MERDCRIHSYALLGRPVSTLQLGCCYLVVVFEEGLRHFVDRIVGQVGVGNHEGGDRQRADLLALPVARQYLLQALPSALQALNVYSEAEREGYVTLTRSAYAPNSKGAGSLYSPNCRQGPFSEAHLTREGSTAELPAPLKERKPNNATATPKTRPVPGKSRN
jgi:hypothetical protein